MARVIVADDDADRVLLRTILEVGGHEVHTAKNGEEALKLYLRNLIQVVVTDIEMPRGDGLELIDALTGLDPDVSIVAVSGKGLPRLQVAQLAGARQILTKPIDRDLLLKAVEDATQPP